IVNFWTDSEHEFGNSIAISEWHYLVLTFDGSKYTCFFDGIQHGNTISDSLTEVTSDLEIGFWKISETQTFDGILDEVRISDTPSSPDWILTEFNNQYDPDSFYSVTSEEIYKYWWADASFLKRKDLAIDPNQFGSVEADQLEDFPFLIDLYDSDLQTKTQSNGADILFVDEEGRKLNHEIELFDQTGNGTHSHLIAWIRIPNLSLRDSTILSMYYNNSELTSQENPEGVWTDDYLGVWHLADNPTGTIYDSTSNNLDGISYGSMTSDDQIIGQIDGSLDFDGVNDYINCSDPVRERFNASEKYTCSLWILVDTDPGSNYPNLIADEAFDGSNGWDFYWWSDSIHVWSCEAQANVVSSGTLNYDQWYFAAFTYDNGAVELFINGSSVDTDSNTFTDSTGDFLIGAYIPDSYYLDGVMDEVRISNVIKSAEWMQVEYKNQYDPDSLYSVGSEITFDETPPEILNFGIDDPGTGISTFWAALSDDSGIESVEVTINNTKYAMSWNGTYWVYDFSVESYQGYYEYLITNASDIIGNYRSSNSSLKNYTFNKDNVDPNVLDWEYYDIFGPYGTFKANITDSWGEIDTVRVNVTTYNMQALMGQYATFGGTIFAYLNDTLEMPNGVMDFQIIVNDTAGNEFISTTHQGDFFSNHPPIVENLTLSPVIPWSNCSLTLAYDYYDEDGHSESGTEIRWYKKNDSVFLLESTYNDTMEIPASALEVGDQWYVNVTPKDGGLFGETNMSAIITILNTPPLASDVVVFYSGATPYTTSTLNVDYTFDDHEGDGEDTTNRQVEWYRNGTHYPALDNSTSVSPGNTTKGETWAYRLRVHDGTGYSSWVT
ncbi:MAG: DUF2341 domain-containing protein, partial [Promethearchaeota archaeon]